MKPQRWIDLGALGMAFGGVLMMILIALVSAIVFGRQGNWFSLLWYVGWPLIGVWVIYLFCKKIKFF